jgi:hypothetical protein
VSSLPPLRAPKGDGEILAVPALERAGELVRENRDRLSRAGGLDWEALRRLARREVLAAAGASEAPLPASGGGGLPGPFFVGGHQPELFHPGVWVKNFALAGLARRHGGVAINLVVDNDTLKSTAVRVPAPANERVAWAHPLLVPYDRWSAETPFEERQVLDEGLFASFGERAGAVMRHWGVEPLLGPFWPAVRRHAGPDGRIGAAFAAARRELERQWGCHNLEAPLSAVCAGAAFGRFAGALLGELPRFVAVHNETVDAYRARHGIRSKRQPVPDLANEDDWLEAPLWGWRAGQSRRGRLFVRRQGDRLRLRAGADPWPDLPAPGHPDFDAAWRGLGEAGCKVRSRALTTTLFSRLLLADLFLHGIGGGKYDELTDELMARFFGIEPPAYLVLSATRWLPLPGYPATADDRRRLGRRLRELRYNPQRCLPAAEQARLSNLVREKEGWVRRSPADRAGRRERFGRLRLLNAQMHLPLLAEEGRVRQELARVEGELQANAVLRRRDYAFCLYPEGALRPFLTALL